VLIATLSAAWLIRSLHGISPRNGNRLGGRDESLKTARKYRSLVGSVNKDSKTESFFLVAVDTRHAPGYYEIPLDAAALLFLTYPSNSS
jgi:hypothetical protein